MTVYQKISVIIFIATQILHMTCFCIKAHDWLLYLRMQKHLWVTCSIPIHFPIRSLKRKYCTDDDRTLSSLHTQLHSIVFCTLVLILSLGLSVSVFFPHPSVFVLVSTPVLGLLSPSYCVLFRLHTIHTTVLYFSLVQSFNESLVLQSD